MKYSVRRSLLLIGSEEQLSVFAMFFLNQDQTGRRENRQLIAIPFHGGGFKKRIPYFLI
jgi:hypothetical protein